MSILSLQEQLELSDDDDGGGDHRVALEAQVRDGNPAIE